MLKTLIIDDEADARKVLQFMLEQYCEDIEIVGEANGVVQGKKMIDQHQPDLVLLDVEMEDGTGFDLLQSFYSPVFKIIFTTAYDHFALDAIKHNALDYLLKPINPNELQRAVEKVKKIQMPWLNRRFADWLEEKMNRPERKLTLPTSEGYEIVKLNNIVRLEADGNYCRLVQKDKSTLVITKTLKEFEQELPSKQFFRSHQSHIVNMDFVKKYLRKDGGYILMENGDLVLVSRRKKEGFLEKLKE